MTINKTDLTNVYLVLDGNKTTNKQEFLKEIGLLLKFPDYYGNNWDALDECLEDIVSIWQQENPTFIEPFTNVLDAIDKGLTVTIIWLNNELMFNNNCKDFFTAVELLGNISADETIPLKFYLGTYIDRYKGDNLYV